MVKIGIVGIGFMGMIHYLAARGLRGGRVVAICSREDKKREGDWRGIRGNFGPPGDIMDLAGVKTYDRLDALLADRDIDLVDICNPTRLHAQTAIRTLQAGKHVLVEKAIALTTGDGEAMVQAASKAGKLLMVAHVLPFFAEFAFALDAIRSGRYGRLLGGHFKRIISRPEWSAEIADPAKTGGPAVDLHIHDTHFIALACGLPKAVFSSGISANGVIEYLNTQYLFAPGGPAISCSSGAVAQKGREFVHGFEIYLENVTLVFESGTCPLTLLKADGKEQHPKLTGGDVIEVFTAELQAAVDGVQSGRAPKALSAELARDALILCHKEIQSVSSGAIVTI